MAQQISAFATLSWVFIVVFSVTEAQNIMDGVFGVLSQWPQQIASGNPFENVTSECYIDTQKYMTDWKSSVMIRYAHEMYYSNGYIRDDLNSTFKDPGQFSNCPSKIDEASPFATQYCYTTFYVDDKLLPGREFELGLCFPDSCTLDDIGTFGEEGVKYLYPRPTLKVQFSWGGCPQESYPFRAGDIVAIIVCVIILIFLIIGTVYSKIRSRKTCEISMKMTRNHRELNTISGSKVNMIEAAVDHDVSEPNTGPNNADSVSNQNTQANIPNDEHTQEDMNIEEGNGKKKSCKDKLQDCLLSFSVIDCARSILSMDHSKDSIQCLNGIRVISMSWIIVLHCYLMTVTGQIVGNRQYVDSYVQTYVPVTVLWRGDLGVEAFFVLSGTLVSYHTLKQLNKCGGPRKFQWHYFYLHRYLRLTPVYAFTLMWYSTLALHMGYGLYWFGWQFGQAVCSHTVWLNLVYLQNLIPFPGYLNACMAWSWYVAVDMQLFIFSPLFILLFYKNRIAGYVVSVVCAIAALGFCWLIAGTFAYLEGASVWYDKPYYRISQYLVGIILGYVLHNLNGQEKKINRWLNAFLWLIVFSVGIYVVYSRTWQGQSLPITYSYVYELLHRTLFSVCIAWVIYACATGNAGFINTFLSWRMWLPLAKMNYVAYLVHLTIIQIYTGSSRYMLYYSTMHMITLFAGIWLITYGVSFLIATTVEMPFLRLEKALIPGRKKSN
ncbi:O-acyltransferase like protein-like [Glandiceps talaboti]